MSRCIGCNLRRDPRGSVMMEFAIIGTALLLVSLGAMDVGFVIWTQGALQTVAAEAARCGAIAASGCTSSSDIETWVQTEAANWIMSSVAANLTVNVNGTVNTSRCPNISVGNFETVEITTSYFTGWLPWPFSSYTIDVCASYAH